MSMPQWGSMPWMGKYPRKGADWSPAEDRELWSRHGFGSAVVELASLHMREPVAIEHRLFLLRARARAEAKHDWYAGVKIWQREQEPARKVVAEWRNKFCLVPRPQGKSWVQFKPGNVADYKGEPMLVRYVHKTKHATHVGLTRLIDLPPEVAQALRFGEGGESC